MATLLLVIIYLGFISLGLPDSLLGSGWPVMREVLGVPTSYMGYVTMIISACTIVSSFFSDKTTKKFGTHFVTVVSIALTVAGLIGFSFSTKFWMLCVFAIPYGLGAGAIDSALNNYVALHYASRHMSWLHAFWGIGAIASPYVMSYALSASLGWQQGYRIVAYIQIGILVVIACSAPLWKKKNVALAEGEEVEPANLTFLQKLKLKGAICLFITFFCYCALESTVMNWASTYMVEACGITEEKAAAYASMFYIGMAVGRIISGFITGKLGDKNMIRLGTSIVAVGLILLFIPVGKSVVAPIAFVVIGLGCAPVYPSIIHSTPYNFGKENSQALIGVEMSFAYAGFTFIPPAFGLIAGSAGAKWLPFFALAIFVLFIVMSEVLNKQIKAEKVRISSENLQP